MYAKFTLLAVLSACAGLPTETDVAPALTNVQRGVPAEALNPDVRQVTIHRTVCVAGYTGTVRPSTSYTNGIKARLIRDQGLPAGSMSAYELDHVIPLALGGHPRSPTNLALQPWDGENSARAKDRLERRLHVLVCRGNLPLDTARRDIYQDWQAAFRKYIGTRQ